MSILILDNGYRVSLPGLGKIRGLLNLSKKRVTIAVREELRRQYGFSYITVSCDAMLASDGWHGSCNICGEEFGYKIAAQQILPAAA